MRGKFRRNNFLVAACFLFDKLHPTSIFRLEIQASPRVRLSRSIAPAAAPINQTPLPSPGHVPNRPPPALNNRDCRKHCVSRRNAPQLHSPPQSPPPPHCTTCTGRRAEAVREAVSARLACLHSYFITRSAIRCRRTITGTRRSQVSRNYGLRQASTFGTISLPLFAVWPEAGDEERPLRRNAAERWAKKSTTAAEVMGEIGDQVRCTLHERAEGESCGRVA